MSAPIMRKESYSLFKTLATDYAANYCAEHDLSPQKLREQRFDVVLNRAIFSQPSGVEPDGLRNDLETMPIPTLIVIADDGNLSIQETADTAKYLSVG